MTDYLHETGELRCPACDDLLGPHDYGDVDSRVGDDGELVRTRLECPRCGAAVDLVVEPAPPEAVGLNIYVEAADE